MATQPETKDARASRERRGISRRLFLGGSLTTAAAASLSARTFAGTQTQGGPASVAGKAVRDDVLTLVNRTTQGYSQAMYDEAQALGFDGYLEWQLDPGSIDDSVLDAAIAGLTTISLSSQELFVLYGPPAGGNGIEPLIELRIAAVLRSILSRRQLHERMVEFWTDHFNILQNDGALRILKTTDDRDVIREHALGNFRDLLYASARSAAMLEYLNNNTNVVGAPNENYSREVMELHTLGVDGPYNEHDIQELARCFTGWTFLGPQSQNYGQFIFAPQNHDTGEKNLLGLSIAAGGGISDANTVLDFLAAHDKTADFIARKMSKWLLAYDPPESVVTRVARAFLDTGGDIKSMIREILGAETFRDAHPDAFPKLRRPFHFITSVVRASGVSVTAPGGLLQHLGLMGQTPFNWASPDGYPDTLAAWGPGVLPRWEFASQLFNSQIPGVAVPAAELFSQLSGAPPSEWGRAINHVLTHGRLSAEDEAEVQAFVDSFANVNPQVVREAYALAASSPSFQYF